LDGVQGKEGDEAKAVVDGFSAEQKELLQAYHKFRQDQSGEGSPAAAGGGGAPAGFSAGATGGGPEPPKYSDPPTPQEQQTIIKDIFAKMKDKDSEEQNKVINALRPVEKEVWDKYNDYQFHAQKEHMQTERRKVGRHYCLCNHRRPRPACTFHVVPWCCGAVVRGVLWRGKCLVVRGVLWCCDAVVL
jgi:hypothetical protein